MRASHYFIATYQPQYEEYKFEVSLPCNAAPEIDTTDGKYYLHRFEYPDSFYYIYCNQKLSGAAEEKLYKDLLAFAP